MKIGYLTKRRDACYHVRILVPSSHLNLNGHQCEDEVFEQIVTCKECQQHHTISYGEYSIDDLVCGKCNGVMFSKDEMKTWHQNVDRIIDESDVVVFQRPTEVQHILLMKKAKKMGKAVVQTADDHYLDAVPQSNPGYVYYKERRGFIEESMKICDGIDVTTPALQKLYSNYCSNVQILPNSQDIELIDSLSPLQNFSCYLKDGAVVREDSFREIVGDRKIVLWGGSPTHEKDLEIVINPLRRLVRSEKVCLVFVGYVHRMIIEQTPKESLFMFPVTPGNLYFMLYKSINADVSIAPVEENEFNRAKCVTGDTRICTKDGFIKIEDISKERDEDCFLDVDGYVNTSHGVRKFSSFYYGGKQECITVETYNGYKITGTKTHKIMTTSGWKMLSEIGEGCEVVLSPQECLVEKYQEVSFPLFYHKWYEQNPDWSNDSAPRVVINEDWGRLLGYIIGDGHVGGAGLKISCSTDYPDIIEDVGRLAKKIGLQSGVIVKKDKRIKNEDGSVKISKGRDVSINSKPLVRFVQHLGLEFGKKKKPRVPDVIFKSPKNVIREFLRGLFESDGTVSKGCASIYFCSLSEQLCRDIQQLLLIFGIKSRVQKRKCKSQNWKVKRDYWYVIMNSKSSRIFHNEINFISLKKIEKLNYRCSLPVSNHTDDWNWTDLVVSQVSSFEDVFDITVPDVHHYIANGIVSHNSSNKMIEAEILKFFPVMSDFDTYRGCSPQGICCKNDDYSWFSGLRNAVNLTEEERAKRVEENRKFVEDNYDIKNNWKMWEKFYQEVLEKKK